MRTVATLPAAADALRGIRAWILAGVAVAAALSAPGASPQALMKEGRRAYAEGRAEEALKKFEEAARAAQGSRLDPAPAEFNQGTALLKLGRGTEAEPFLEKALRTSDLRLQSRTWYNRGCELAERSSGLAAQQKLQEAQAPLESAIAAYENAITLDPADPEAKVNYELALRALEELKKQIEQQQQQQQQQDQQKKEQEDQKSPSQEQKNDDDQKKQDPQDQPKGGEEQKQEPQKQEAKADQPKQEPQAGTGEGGQEQEEQMTPEEARMLLDAMKAEEEAGRDRLRLRLGQPVPVDKNW